MLKKNNNHCWISLFFVTILLSIFAIYRYKSVSGVEYVLGKGVKVEEFSFGKIKLTKKDETWWVESDNKKVPASNVFVESWLERLDKLPFDKKISENKDRFEEFGINDSSNRFNINKKTYVVGGIGDRYESSFIKKEGQEAVYEVPVIWGDGGPSTIEYWIEEYATNIPYTQVLEVKRDGNILKTDEKFLKTICYIKLGNYLGESEPRTDGKHSFEIKYGENVGYIEIGKGWIKYGKFYYSLPTETFDLLTTYTGKS